MSNFGHVWGIAKQHKWRILFTYTLLITEFVVFAMIPYFMGKAIDCLLVNNFSGFYWYLAISVGGFLSGFFRRRVDTRTFMRIWQIRTFDAIRSLIARGIESPRIISRANLARTYGDFLEYTLPSILNAVIEISIATVMLWLVVPTTTYFVFGLVVAAILLQYLFSIVLRKIEVLAQREREQIDRMIVQQNVEEIGLGYDNLRKFYIRASDLEATCWGVVHLLGVASVVLVVFALLGDGKQTAIFGKCKWRNNFFRGNRYSHGNIQ